MNHLSSFLRISIFVILLFVFDTRLYAQKCNCDHTITLGQTPEVDGATLKYMPGDTVCIEAGKRPYLDIRNVNGTAAKPIVFINCGGQVVVSNTVRWGIAFSKSKHFKLMGTGDSNFKYGIKIDGVATVGVSFHGLSNEFETGFIEIYKSLGMACVAKSDPECGRPETWRENFVMRNISIHDFYIHNVGTKAAGGEGFYIGHSFFNGIDTQCGKLYPHNIENIKVYNNIIENTAFDGMQVSCAISGCEVYNNTISNFGMLNNGSQQTGLVIGGGSKGKFYNNRINKGTGAGITVFGQGDVFVFNNVVSNTDQESIFCDDRTTDPNLGFHFYNNTLINSKLNGITMYSALSKGNTFYNNLIVNPGNWTKFYDYRRSCIYLENLPNKVVKFDTANNYFIKDVANANFVDPNNLDFHLNSDAPAIDRGKDLNSQGVTFDLNYNARPVGKAFDIGAYEYSPSSGKVLNLNVNSIGVTCKGTSSGKASVAVSGGTEPYTYLWSTGETTSSISNLAAGNYSLLVTDAEGNEGERDFTINEPAEISIGRTITNESASGNDGAIDLLIQGGTSPYTYTWSHGPTSQDLNNLSAGDYTITVKDIHNCTASQTITITKVTSALSATLQVDNVKCFGANTGSASLSISGGVSPYSILWSTGNNAKVATGLSAGAYSVKVTDAANATKDLTFSVTQPNALVIQGSVTHEKAGNDGAVGIIVAGGISPYSFSWSNGKTTKDISSLKPGTYSVSVKDQNNCSSTKSFVVLAPLSIQVSTKDITCFGSKNGAASVVVKGGLAPYTYSWSNGKTTSSVSSLSAGDYTVTIKDQNGTSVVKTLTIGEPQRALTVAKNITNESTLGQDGAIDLTISGGVAPYNVLWSNMSVSEDLTGISSGSYTVTIKDKGGCTITEAINVLKLQDPFKIIVATKPVSCNGGSDGSASAQVTGGSPPYTYYWSNSASTADVTGLAAGSYSLVVSDQAGNKRDLAVEVTQPEALKIEKIVTGELVGNDGAINISISGGSAPYVFEWSNGGRHEDLVGLQVGIYDLKVTDNSGCSIIESISVEQAEVVDRNILPVVDAGQDTAVFLPVSQLTLTGSAYDPDGNIERFLWEQIGGPPLTFTDNFSPSLTITNLRVGRYTFRLTATDGKNGHTTDEVNVEVQDAGLRLAACKFFSPNGDNSGNETWIIENIDEISGCQLLIFNEHGQKVYETRNYANDWDGKLNGANLPEGPYYYQVLCSGNDGRRLAQGSLRLIR